MKASVPLARTEAAVTSRSRKPHGLWPLDARFISAVVLVVGILPSLAKAADGCLVLLCLAAPSWSNVPQCVDPVRQALSDVARGRPFPSCSAAGSGNSASYQWASAPSLCPQQYTHATELESTAVYTCDYDAVVSVTVEGSLWSRTWWRLDGGDTVTEFSPAAKAQLGSWDPRFDDDYARWLGSRSVRGSDCASC